MAVLATGRKTPTGMRGPRLLPWATVPLLLGGLASSLALATLAVAIYHDARTDERTRSDGLLVLGAAQINGRPTRAFRARLDHALDLYQQGFAPVIVLVGGTADPQEPTEAEVGAAYLAERGIPASALVVVPEGRNTWQSLAAARPAMEKAGLHQVLVVSDGFHLFRTKRMLRDLGFQAHGSPAPGSPIRQYSPIEFSYMARELVAVLAYLVGSR
jgi:vancomycin permeability regulator SanA